MSHLMVETDPGTREWTDTFDPDPLAKYNSLTDNHLAGYFSSPRRRKHLRKAGLITRSGHLVSENTYRLNMVQKEHKKRVKNMLAQAIVEKTLDLERNRNHVIRQKLEEIAKLELVQRIREEEKERPITKKSSRPESAITSPQPKHSPKQRRVKSASERKPREDNLPYLSPRSPRRPVSGPAKPKPHSPAKCRPISAPENNHRPESGSTKASTNFDDEEEGDVEYLDVTPRRNGDVSFRSDNNNLDYKQLYTLNAAALRKYAMTLAKLEQGRGSSSPYVTTQVPIPPRSPRAPNRSARSRRYVSSGHSDRSLQGGTHTAPGTFHSSDLTTVHPRQLQSVVQVVMRYHGWNLSLARDDRDPTNLVLVEQQHCGGNTLTVFKDNLLPNTEFSFSSHRHRGYPFSLTIYVDGRMDCRVSTCCEHRHSKNVRIGGPNGHFSLVSVTGNSPCYKCQVERGGKKKKKKKQAAAPEDGTEEVIVMETHQAPENQVEEKKDQTKDEDEEDSEDEGKEILVPVEKEADDDNTSAIEQNEIESGDYDDDFEDDGEEEDKSKKVENVKEEEKIETAQKQNNEKPSGNVEVKEEEEDDEENEVTIEGLAVESPRNVHDTPNITVVEKEGGDNGRKIDAYSSEEEDLEGERNKVVAMEKEQKRAEVPQLSIRPNTSTPVNQTSGKQKTHPPASTKTKDSDTKSNNPKNSKHDESYLPLEAKWSRRDDVSPSSEPTNDVIERSSPQNSSSNQNSPNKTPDVVYTVWSEEETASSQSNDQDDWTEKKGQITQNILDEFGDKEVSQYEADDEGTERSTKDTKNQVIAGEIIKTFGQNADPVDDTSAGNQNKNSRVAEEIVKNFGQNEQVGKNEDKSKRVAEEIVKAFGQNDDRNQDSTQVSGVQQEFNQSKNSRVAEEIVKNFGQNDKQDRESSPDSTGQRENHSKNSRVAEEIVKNFGQEDEQSRESTERREKNRRVADEIVKNFGQNPDSDAENSNQRVASEFVRTFGKVDPQEEADKNQRIAEEIVKSFGQSEVEKEDSNKNQRVAEEIVKSFGQTDEEKDSNKNQRVAEEIVKSFGQTEEEKESNKNQRVAEEIVKNFSQIDDPEQRFDQERPSVNNLDSEKPVTKDSAALVSRSPGIGNPDLRKMEEKSESGDSTEREITQRKKDSQEFFKPALEKKQNSVSDTETSSSGTETESDSETSSSSSSTDSNNVVTTTSNSNLTTKTIEAPTTGSNVHIPPSSSSSSSLPQQPPTDNAKADVNPSINNVAMTTNASKQYKESDTEDTSSDSDTESGSSSSSSDSTSDSEEEKEKDPATPANTQGSEVKQVTGQSTEVANKTQTQKDEVTNVSPRFDEEDKKDDDEGIEPDVNSPSHEPQPTDHPETESQLAPQPTTKSKSVSFRNTPETIENPGLDYEEEQAEEVETGGGDNSILSKKGRIHGGSIQHLLEAENDIKLDGIHLDKHQIEEIYDSLKDKEELKTLSLLNCGLNDDDVSKICDAMVTSASEPIMMNLILNNLTSKGMESLVEVMRAEPTLDILLLQGNEIGDEGVRILTEGIVDIHLDARKRRKISLIRQSSELQVVQVHAHHDGSVPQAPKARRNSLFDPAVNARFCRLGELDLGDVGLTDAGIEYISRMLEQNVYLETLSISANPGITKSGWLRLGQALEKNRRLQTLTLDFNDIGDDGVTFLCRGLKNNRTLLELDMEETNIGERGGRMLVELLKRNTTINDMVLMPGNDIPEHVQMEIRKYLAMNKANDDGY